MNERQMEVSQKLRKQEDFEKYLNEEMVLLEIFEKARKKQWEKIGAEFRVLEFESWHSEEMEKLQLELSKLKDVTKALNVLIAEKNKELATAGFFAKRKLIYEKIELEIKRDKTLVDKHAVHNQKNAYKNEFRKEMPINEQSQKVLNAKIYQLENNLNLETQEKYKKIRESIAELRKLIGDEYDQVLHSLTEKNIKLAKDLNIDYGTHVVIWNKTFWADLEERFSIDAIDANELRDGLYEQFIKEEEMKYKSFIRAYTPKWKHNREEFVSMTGFKKEIVFNIYDTEGYADDDYDFFESNYKPKMEEYYNR